MENRNAIPIHLPGYPFLFIPWVIVLVILFSAALVALGIAASFIAVVDGFSRFRSKIRNQQL